MVSCAQRKPVRAITLAQFRSLGIEVGVYEDPCTSPSPSQVLKNAWNAVTTYDDSPLGLLYVEDDIDLNPDSFLRILEMVVSFNQITALCLLRHRLYPAWVKENAQEMLAEVVPLHDYDVRRGFHGTMCVYLPVRVVNHITESRYQFMTSNGDAIEGADGFDFWLKMNAERHGGLYAAIPNPVNHRPGYSMWGKRNRWQDFQSTTFKAKAIWKI